MDQFDVTRLWTAARDALQRARDDDARAEAAEAQAAEMSPGPAAANAARRFRAAANASEWAACEAALTWHKAHLRGRGTKRRQARAARCSTRS